MIFNYLEYCVCPNCRVDLIKTENGVRCIQCLREYPIEDGILLLLPEYKGETQIRYQRNYEVIAKDYIDLNRFKSNNDAHKYQRLLRFIGRKHKGKKILDIGSGQAFLLEELDADFKVAFDISLTRLKTSKQSDKIIRIQGDAELLPFKPKFFDLIIISDILEHLLHTDELINVLRLICSKDTRIFVHVPWEEDISSYLDKDYPYEFAHLRSFNAFNYNKLWLGFKIVRYEYTTPNLWRMPLIFRLDGYIPLPIYNTLVWCYFHIPGLQEKDYQQRDKWFYQLPRNEWWLLRLFKPMFRTFEMRFREDTPIPLDSNIICNIKRKWRNISIFAKRRSFT